MWLSWHKKPRVMLGKLGGFFLFFGGPHNSRPDFVVSFIIKCNVWCLLWKILHWNDHKVYLGHVWATSCYFDGAKKEWNTDATRRRIIYISVVNFYFYIYFGVFGLRYTHHVSFPTTERVGLGFFSFFFFW